MSSLPRLLVFSDDWGRHPSSCQHLISHLLRRDQNLQVTWVNTIGMRPPRLDLQTVQRGVEKIRGWVAGAKGIEREADAEIEIESAASAVASGVDVESRGGLRVVDAKMWPWMTHHHDRWLNQRLLRRQLRGDAEGAIAITTVPIVADLVGKLPVRHWVYYCVDDFSVWPGLDGKTLGRMEDELVARVDAITVASDNLALGIRRRGRDATVLTHGVDLPFWRAERTAADYSLVDSFTAPVILFWGVVDRRMNADWVLRLADQLSAGTVILAGPQQDPDPRLRNHHRIQLPGPVPFEQLPAMAASADVLIMPYADLPVTRAMQPLKLKEYLATGKPVVVSPLPAVRGWESCLDVAVDEASFVEKVLANVTDGGAASVQTARMQLLAAESWSGKADHFAQLIVPPSDLSGTTASQTRPQAVP